MKRNHSLLILLLCLPHLLFSQDIATVGERFFKDLTTTTITGLADRASTKELFQEMYLPQLLKKDPEAKSKEEVYLGQFYTALQTNYEKKLAKTREALQEKGFDLAKLEYEGNIEMEITVWKSSESEQAKVKVDKANGDYHLESTNYIVTVKQDDHYAFLEVIGLLYNKKYSVVEVKGVLKDIEKSSTRYRVLHDNLTKVFTSCYKDKRLESVLKEGEIWQDEEGGVVRRYATDIEFYRLGNTLAWDVEEKIKGLTVRRTQYIEGELNISHGTMESAMQDVMLILGFMAKKVETGLEGRKYDGDYTKTVYTPSAGNFTPTEEGKVITKGVMFMPNVVTSPYFVQIKIEKKPSNLMKSGYVFWLSMSVQKTFGRL